jgi:flagellar motor switch protein FliN
MADSGELDFSNLDGMDDIDWSDVEGELQQNRDMLIQEAKDSKKPADDSLGALQSSGEGSESITLSDPTDLDIDFLMDVPLRLTVEIGRTKILIKDLLNIDVKSVIELKKKIGAPMNVLINDKQVAKGEIIVQNEKFGLKITQILNEKERLQSLRDC